MTAKPRFVFDTNAVISAVLLKRSVARQSFDKAIAEGDLLVSEETLEELNSVLRRSDFAKYVTEDERMEFLAAFMSVATLVTVTGHVQECRDPKDDKFLDLALSGLAVCIVTGDKDLLVLDKFRGISIITPREFLDGTKNWLD